MLNMRHEGKYNAELNMVEAKLINKPQSFEDVDYVVSENEKLYKEGGENKVWLIADISEMGMASPKFVKYFQEKEKILVDKYVIDTAMVCSNPLEKMAAQLFNILSRQKSAIFKIKEEAIEWVLKEQETRGRFEPLEQAV
jgi:hypothetical protein